MTGTSRRRLLAGTLGGSLLAQVHAAPEVRLPRKIRLALAGFDGHPEEILRVLPQLPDVELVAVAGEASDPDAQANAFKNRYVAKARRYETLDRLLAAEQLDVVAVCNHNGRRTAAILACAARKLNVIAEKPLALHRAGLDAVYDAVQRSGIHLGMLLPMRFDPPYLAMRRIVESGAIGEVLQMDAQKSYQLGARPAWQKHSATYGSTILWIAIHSIDLMLWVGGRSFTEAASLQSHVGFPEAGLRKTAFAKPPIFGPPTRLTAVTASSTAANAGTRMKKICRAATQSAARASGGRPRVGFFARASSSASMNGSTRSVP